MTWAIRKLVVSGVLAASVVVAARAPLPAWNLAAVEGSNADPSLTVIVWLSNPCVSRTDMVTDECPVTFRVPHRRLTRRPGPRRPGRLDSSAH
jgi:hypothetical protein